MAALKAGKGPAVRVILAAFSALWVYGTVDALLARGSEEKRGGN